MIATTIHCHGCNEGTAEVGVDGVRIMVEAAVALSAVDDKVACAAAGSNMVKATTAKVAMEIRFAVPNVPILRKRPEKGFRIRLSSFDDLD